MNKLKEAEFRALCQSNGYTGDSAKDTIAVMKAWAIEQKALVPVGDKTVPIDQIEIEAVATKTWTAPIKGADEPVEDIQAKVSGAVTAELKRLGIGPQVNRPLVADATQIGTVKSVAQVLYEDQIKRGTARFSSYENAMAFKHWVGANFITRNPAFADRAADEQTKLKTWMERISGKAYSTNSVTQGAALMPDQFIPDLIRNVLEYGVARQLCKVVPMTTVSATLPRRTGGLTMYYPQENVAATASTATYDNVTLRPKTGVVLTQASQQSLDDSSPALMDLTMEEIAYTIAQGEDDAVLISDGSATYGGMTGYGYKFGTIATDGGYVVVGGADTASHTAAQVDAAIARVPQYARGRMAITCHSAVKATIFDRLATSTPGGLLLKEIVGMGLVSHWKGIPIIENNSMNSTLATPTRPGFTSGDDIDFLIGDFSRAGLLGDRMQVQLDVDTSLGFSAYSVYLRGVVRFDFVAHSVGTSSAAGPIVSFWQT